jgi:hypothetical protein
LRIGKCSDPARVIELRDELRERMMRRHDDRNAKPRARYAAAHPRRPRERRRRSNAQVSAALALLAEGKTQRQAAAAVGVSCTTVCRWRREAA